ncbi:MAG: hypothetical protein NVS4B12_23200 [Ktedonobacteraceae bacterium]
MQRYTARSLFFLPLFMLLPLFFTACGGDTASTPTAQQLIKNAQAALQKVNSYHFNLVAENAGAGGFLVVKSADGDTVVPDKLQADADAVVLGSVVKVKIISIADKQYVTDPISGKWQLTTGLLDPRTLSDSKTGIVAILGLIEKPSTPTDSNVDGKPCWNISGKLNAKDIQGITGGGTPANVKDDVTTCIGKSDNLPYQIRITGMAIQGDTNKTVRTFKLSKFNESITIAAPI